MPRPPARASDARPTTPDPDPRSHTPARAFHACYLVISLDPRKRGKSYIGYTINPPRRLAQHNGALSHGARYTASLRPCDMVLVVSGFESEVMGMRFEWAWQRPASSRSTRAAAARIGVSDRTCAPKKKAEMLCVMLGEAPWRNMPLTLHRMSAAGRELVEKHLGTIPEHVTVRDTSAEEMEAIVAASGRGAEEENFARMSERDLNVDASGAPVGTPSVSASERRGDAPCGLDDACGRENRAVSLDRSVACEFCRAVFHPTCLAKYFFQRAGDEAKAWSSQVIPERGPCPRCRKNMTWGAALRAGQNISAFAANANDSDDDDDVLVVSSGVKTRRMTSSAEKRIKQERERVQRWARLDLDANFDDSDSESDDIKFVSLVQH